MPVKQIQTFLDTNHINYSITKHPRAFTAQEIAASAHIPGKKLAKTVLVKADGKLKMAVLPASYHLNLDQLRTEIGCQNIRLANEQEFKDKFPDCEVGAMPPFGNLYGLDVVVAASLVEDEEIMFNAGSHTELMKMRYNDFETLVHPKLGRFSSKNRI